jgi:hypothetical protein
MLYKNVEMPGWEEVGKTLLKYFSIEEYKNNSGFRSNDPKLFEKCKPLVKIISNYTDWSNLENIAIITVQPDVLWPIHTDWLISVPYSLNIPIYNCTKETYTSFYKIKEETKLRINEFSSNKISADGNYLKYNSVPDENFFDPDEVEEIDRFYLLEPTLYRIDVPHKVTNTGSDIRVSISLRFKTHVDF